MSSAVVWFQNHGKKPNENKSFELLLVQSSAGPGGSMGASMVREKSRGPASEFTVVRDPGGSALALCKRARS